MTTTAPPPPAPKPIRSPGWPSMSLPEAIEEVGKIERLYRSAPVDRTVAAKVIGYSTLSGPANKSLAALADYGLLERAGKGETRVTERARDILHPTTPELRRQRLIEAAAQPELFRELRERFVGLPVPPEDGVVSHLNRIGFNPNAVRPAAKAFLATMSYLEELGASESNGAGQANAQNSGPTPSATYGGAVVGDLIQWEVDKVLKLEKPTRVRAVGTHEGKQFVFVDGSETGMPMDQVIVEKKGGFPPTLPLQEPDGLMAPFAKPTDKDWDVRLLGDRLQIKASVDVKGLRRLLRILKANETLMSTIDDDERVDDEGTPTEQG